MREELHNLAQCATPWKFVLFFGFLFLASAGMAHAGTLAQFRTPFGDIEVELYDQDKPVTVSNFVHYVQSGAYENEFAHRLVPGFVVQGGGFSVTNRGTTNATIVPAPTYSPITNEFGVGRRFSNVFGTIAMAKLGGDTNSATSQWFFNLANNTFLDAADTNDFFVVFGHVVRGTNILNELNRFVDWSGLVAPQQNTNLILHQYYTPPFDDLPLLHPYVDATNFLFMDITLLQVAVNPVAGTGNQISWNSPSGMTNVVEFTTNFPAVWHTLVQTNGTGTRITVSDATGSSRRFYRVRVAY